MSVFISSILFGGSAKAETPSVLAHRGGRAIYPESSRAAFEHALALGVDFLDTDVHFTKDDVAVLHHDPVLNADVCLDENGERITGKKISVRSLTLAELQKYDCGSIQHPAFPHQHTVPGTRVMTLAELFELVKTTPGAQAVRVNIELKAEMGEEKPAPADYARMVAEVIQKAGMQERVLIASMNPVYSRAYHQLARSRGWSQYEALYPPSRIATSVFVRATHALGKKVFAWTANEAETWAKLVDAGVDGIITDDPDGLIEFLRSLKP